MLRLILISALVALTVARTPVVRPIVPMLSGRIVGGEQTTIEALPYQISLQSWGSHICGGSVISANRVLTAAHCTAGSSASSLSVRAGSSNRGSGGTVAQVASICDHPGYNPRTIDNDVSVLRLASNLPISGSIRPINLASVGSAVAVGGLATVSGWGTTSQGGSLPTVLLKVDVPKVSQQTCKNAYGSSAITDTMTCHGFAQGGKDSCQGDSGGPLAVGNTQVGVVSWGAGCAQAGYPGVYADPANAGIQRHILSC